MKLKEDIRLIARALREVHRVQKGIISVIVSKAFVDALSPFLTLYLSAVIIDGITEKRELSYLLTITGITVGLEFILLILSRILRRFLHIGLYTKYFFKKDMHESEKMFDIDYADIESSEFHKFMQKRADLSKFNGADISFYANRLPSVVGNFLKVLFSCVLTWELFYRTADLPGILGFLCSGWGSVIMILAVILSVCLQMRFTSKSAAGVSESIRQMAKYTRTVSYYQDEVLSTYKGGKDIRLYGMKARIEKDLADNFEKIKMPLIRAERTASGYMVVLTVLECLLNMLIYLFVGLKTLSGIFGVGSVVQYIGSIKEFSGAFVGLMNDFSEMRARTEAVRLYFDYMDMPSKLDSGSRALTDPDRPHEIVFDDVSFRYPEAESFSLRHIHIRIRAGTRLAVVGANGSGKTTFIKLLCRLYRPDEGKILLDGVDIEEYRYDEYLAILSVVFQDFKLFSFSLGQNVAAGACVDAARAEDALCKAGFGERFDRLEQKLDTFLYHDFDLHGVEISGGEAQKIALARALYKDAPVVVLDEPTAALDPISESEIYSGFDRMIEGKTAIYISHRLSSCRFCDEIAVFEGGRIVQNGSHSELLRDESGMYYRLWHAQAQYYENTKGENENESTS